MLSHGLGPVFLVGCPRSGTTLLRRMIDAHTAMAIAPETHFIRRFYLRRDDYGSLADDNCYRRLVDAIAAQPEMAEMGIDPDRYRAASRDGPRTYGHLFGLLLEHFRSAQGCSVIGEKTPNHLLYMPTLQQFFPDARFVHIIRDPRGVVNSWRHVPWSTGQLAGDAEVWRRYLATSRRRPPLGQDRLCQVHYEALVTAPELTLRRICQFLGVEFDLAMLRYDQIAPPARQIAEEPWKEAASRPLDLSAVDRWREELSAAAIGQIEAVACREMRPLGYVPLTSRFQLWPMASAVAVRRFSGRLLHWSRGVVR